MALSGQRHAPAVLPPGRRLYALCTGGWVVLRVSLYTLEETQLCCLFQDASTKHPAWSQVARSWWNKNKNKLISEKLSLNLPSINQENKICGVFSFSCNLVCQRCGRVKCVGGFGFSQRCWSRFKFKKQLLTFCSSDQSFLECLILSL